MSQDAFANDQEWMRRALTVAQRGAGWTNPNPTVGAVVVRENVLVGEGFTQPYGGDHAEWQALQQAEKRAAGATLYVTWEPCVAYPNKHTPPCANRIIEAGIARVVVATQDPHPHVQGRGIALLRQAGLDVRVGVLQDEARHLNEISIVYHTLNRPFVCLKWAMTLDGKIATSSNDSKWISNKSSRTMAHRLRHRYAAILVGINTVLADDPALTVRHISGKDPWRFVLDSSGKMPLDARMLHVESDVPTTIATTQGMPQASATRLTDAGACVWRLPQRDGRPDLNALLTEMKAQGIDSVLVEGGSQTHWSFLSQGLFDKVVCFVAPKLLGGRRAPGPLGGPGFETMAQALKLTDLSVQTLDGDLVISAYPNRA